MIVSQNGPCGKLYTNFNHSVLAQNLLRIPTEDLFLELEAYFVGDLPQRTRSLLSYAYIFWKQPKVILS